MSGSDVSPFALPAWRVTVWVDGRREKQKLFARQEHAAERFDELSAQYAQDPSRRLSLEHRRAGAARFRFV